MFGLFSKKIIIVEYPHSVSIYDSYQKVKRDTELLQFVNTNMSLTNNSTKLEALFVNPDASSFPITIYSVTKKTSDILSPAAKIAFNQYHFSFLKSAFDLDSFSAFSFRKYID